MKFFHVFESMFLVVSWIAFLGLLLVMSIAAFIDKPGLGIVSSLGLVICFIGGLKCITAYRKESNEKQLFANQYHSSERIITRNYLSELKHSWTYVWMFLITGAISIIFSGFAMETVVLVLKAFFFIVGYCLLKRIFIRYQFKNRKV